MDTSQQYVNMCELAHEIQLLKPEKISMNPYGIDTPILWSVTKFEPVREEIVWLPRQEQLQKMCIDNVGTVNTPLAMSAFIDSFNNFLLGIAAENGASGVGLYNSIDTLEKVWLMFTMRNVYKKRWNILESKWELIMQFNNEQ